MNNDDTSLDGIIFQEPPDDLDENWLGAIVGTFGGHRSHRDVAKAYYNAADCLLKRHEQDHFEWEILDPLLFLYRHAIEVSLKSLLEIKKGKFPQIHKLPSLFESVTNELAAYGYEMPQRAANIVNDFSKFDPGSTSFRYDGDWTRGEYWIGFPKLKAEMDWLSLLFDEIHNEFEKTTKTIKR